MKKRLARLFVTVAVVTGILLGGAGDAQAADRLCAKFNLSDIGNPTFCIPLL